MEINKSHPWCNICTSFDDQPETREPRLCIKAAADSRLRLLDWADVATHFRFTDLIQRKPTWCRIFLNTPLSLMLREVDSRWFQIQDYNTRRISPRVEGWKPCGHLHPSPLDELYLCTDFVSVVSGAKDEISRTIVLPIQCIDCLDQLFQIRLSYEMNFERPICRARFHGISWERIQTRFRWIRHFGKCCLIPRSIGIAKVSIITERCKIQATRRAVG